MDVSTQQNRPVPRAASPARHRGHIPALDGLRGAAALLVVASHLPSVGLLGFSVPQSGTFGVMIFFVLSGFLMGHLYLFKPFDGPAVFHFIVARIARVIPLFYAVIIGSLVLSKLLGTDFTYYISTKDALKHLAFVGSSYVFWSIPPEVEFYFLFAGMWGVFATRRAGALLPLLGFGVFLLMAAQPAFPGVTVFHSLQIFLAGVGCAVLRNAVDIDRISKRAVLAVQLLGIVLIALILTSVIPTAPTALQFGWEKGRVYESLPMALVFGAFVFAFTIETRFAVAVFGNGVARRIGAYSFSIYLLHEPVATAARNYLVSLGAPYPVQIVGAILIVIAVAAASFHCFEMPMQTLVRRLAVRFGRKFETAQPVPQEAPRGS